MLREALPEIVTKTLPGPKAQSILERRHAVIPNAIGCVYPAVIERGAGAIIEDVDGNRFLDWIGGVGVLNIGYSHPEVVQAVQAQAERYFHAMFNVVTHEGYVALGEKLCELAPVRGEHKKAFFANSGAEADENAVKVARASTFMETGVEDICFTEMTVPTVSSPSSRNCAAQRVAASSIKAIMAGVAKTSRFPLPIALAVLLPVTVVCAEAWVPTINSFIFHTAFPLFPWISGGIVAHSPRKGNGPFLQRKRKLFLPLS